MRVMRLKIMAARMLGRVPTPREVHADLLAGRFAHLDPAVVDQFFANFGFTMPLPLLDELQRFCRERRPPLVVEFGAGVSTSVLEEEVSRYGGFLLSVEDDVRWLADAQVRLPRRGCVGFAYVPARAEDADRINYHALASLLGGQRAGLVVIDGPAHGDRFSPGALELYRALATPETVFAIDDTDREHENDGARQLAEGLGLSKRDSGDPMFPNHRYSILDPRAEA